MCIQLTYLHRIKRHGYTGILGWEASSFGLDIEWLLLMQIRSRRLKWNRMYGSIMIYLVLTLSFYCSNNMGIIFKLNGTPKFERNDGKQITPAQFMTNVVEVASQSVFGCNWWHPLNHTVFTNQYIYIHHVLLWNTPVDLLILMITVRWQVWLRENLIETSSKRKYGQGHTIGKKDVRKTRLFEKCRRKQEIDHWLVTLVVGDVKGPCEFNYFSETKLL